MPTGLCQDIVAENLVLKARQPFHIPASSMVSPCSSTSDFYPHTGEHVEQLYPRWYLQG
ncbi:hypothetical protein PILCRDRAFT_811630 [Piloderma croceum F 1598]|uniref:Uncharacterized protein n=1 Tax=Piloderma croceum (strain F 1598) TaxID=765440 RepID=A0A0C3GHI8_PILCF|nr:hypothetical protein PILCRDRAFT_811630 [Piloderma croceum F 1598]